MDKLARKQCEEETVTICPHCGSEIIKKHGFKGENNEICVKIAEKRSDEQWRGLLRGMVKNEPSKIISEEIGISISGVWLNRQKVCAMLTNTVKNNDKFIDIAECDEFHTVSAYKHG